MKELAIGAKLILQDSELWALYSTLLEEKTSFKQSIFVLIVGTDKLMLYIVFNEEGHNIVISMKSKQ